MHSDEGQPYIHNYTKDIRKKGRTLVKSIRHKLLMNIPLTVDEKALADEFGIRKDWKLNSNRDGMIYCHYKKSEDE